MADHERLARWIAKRKASLEAARNPHESLWIDIRDNYEPSIGIALDGEIDPNTVGRGDDKIFNSKPRTLLHRLSAGLQSGITNQARQWFRFMAPNRSTGTPRNARSYLDAATMAVQNELNRSNVYPTLDQIYLRLGAFGTSGSLLVPDGDYGVRMILCDEGSYWIAEDIRGRVNTLMRRIAMTAGQAEEEFGKGSLPAPVRQLIDNKRYEENVFVWNLVCPAEQVDGIGGDILKDRPFASVYWYGGACGGSNTGTSVPDNHVIAVRSYDYNPIIAPRWNVRGGTAYGIGPGEMGLGDAKELQQLELAKMKLVEGEADPAMLAPSSMRGEPVDTGPGGLTYYPEQPQSTGTTRPVQRLFETRQSIEAVQMAITQVEDRLSQTFFQDLFSMMMNLNLAPKEMTAREVSELSAEKVALLGPILTRLNSDLLSPLVDGVWAIMVRQARENGDVHGILDAPRSLSGEEFSVEYVSSLHIEQQSSSRLSGLYRLLEFSQGCAQVDPNVPAKLDVNRMLDIAAESLREGGAVRDSKEAQKIIAQRQQAAMQAQQAQEMEAQSQAVRNMADAKLQDGSSALEALAGVGGPGPGMV